MGQKQHVFHTDITEAIKDANSRMQGRNIYYLQDVVIALKTKGNVYEEAIESAKAMDFDEKESILNSLSRDELNELKTKAVYELGDRAYYESEKAGKQIDYKVQWYDKDGRQEITVKPANYDIAGNLKKDGSDKANFYQNGVQKTLSEIQNQMRTNAIRGAINLPKNVKDKLEQAVEKGIQEFGR